MEAVGICKSFPGVRALDDVSLCVAPGEVLCVVGENGAGKSTLMKILGGALQPDAGTLRIEGQPIHLTGVPHAQRLGIALIHQELNLADSLDVAANIFLGREPCRAGPLRLIDRSIYAAAGRVLDSLGVSLSPYRRVGGLSIGQQQLVEIARALSMQSRLLIMDEPTSSLTQRETQRLFAVIGDLKSRGVSVVYISHRLAEVEAIADRVTVLRDGRNAGELARGEITHEALVRRMVGRDLKQFFPRTLVAPRGAPALLEVCGAVVSPRQPEPISFGIAAGEVVAMAGLMGAGRTRLAQALFGIRPLLAGEVRVQGRRLRSGSPQAAIAAGLFLVPEDRRQLGLVLAASVQRNISLPSLHLLQRAGLVRANRERALAQQMVERLRIRTPHLKQAAALLSGGNQQKVVLAKWLARQARVLILDEPTRGVDVGAKTEIYGLIDALAQEGVGILMISSELEEILGMADRVLVMHEGRLAGELAREQLSEEAIMRLATGGKAA
ncbi:MAG: sugar ABC transporter ATP-binding protein [Pirellulales bacterium]|nr:sugar ABC transporter ATP-binding protein [Pirellulales bacterium]